MSRQLSIRSYSRLRCSHAHDYHQLVLPLIGVIEIELEGFVGRVAPGECVLIRQGQVHHFMAEREARFVVVDTDFLPENLQDAEAAAFAVNQPLARYLEFVEAQLEAQVNPKLEDSMFDTLMLLLAEQRLAARVDPRVQKVLRVIDERLAEKLTLHDLARSGCLGETQLKKLFREQVGESVMQYVTRVRMEKARALLQHTDFSVQQVAEQVGYSDLSAFSRRFSSRFGLSPARLRR